MQPRAALLASNASNEALSRARRTRVAHRASTNPSGLFDNAETWALKDALSELVLDDETPETASTESARAWELRNRQSVWVSTLVEAAREATIELVAAVLVKDWASAARLAFEGGQLSRRGGAHELGLSALEALEGEGVEDARRWTLVLVAARAAGAQLRASLLADPQKNAAGREASKKAGLRESERLSRPPLDARAAQEALTEAARSLGQLVGQYARQWASASASEGAGAVEQDLARAAARLLEALAASDRCDRNGAKRRAVASVDVGRLAFAETLAELCSDRLRTLAHEKSVPELERELRLAIAQKAQGWAERVRERIERNEAEREKAASEALDAFVPLPHPPRPRSRVEAALASLGRSNVSSERRRNAVPRLYRASPFVAETT